MKNREKHYEYMKKWNEKNREKMRAWNREYRRKCREENKKTIFEAYLEYLRENIE